MTYFSNAEEKGVLEKILLSEVEKRITAGLKKYKISSEQAKEILLRAIQGKEELYGINCWSGCCVTCSKEYIQDIGKSEYNKEEYYFIRCEDPETGEAKNHIDVHTPGRCWYSVNIEGLSI